MGKLKVREKKFDRDVEISAPILDPEIIEAIHSPHRLDLRHGGFRALLADGADQTTTMATGGRDQMTPTYEVNHLPSYIGISCAVSGYPNYYNSQLLGASRPLDDSTNTRSESNISRASASHHRLTSTPTPSRASNTQVAPIVSHFKLDKSKFGCIDQERRELTGLMAASISEKQLYRRHPTSGSPDSRLASPVPPTESGRHHGAYVGARYSPMPDPSEEVPKHIPLLGIDDELNPEEALEAVEAENKVVHRVASLYGEDFAESWQEDVSNKVRAGSGQQDQLQQ